MTTLEFKKEQYIIALNEIADLRKLIEDMKCCGNCYFMGEITTGERQGQYVCWNKLSEQNTKTINSRFNDKCNRWGR